MRLVLVEDGQIDERLSRELGALNNMKNNIKFCNQAIQELIDPITHSKKLISVHKNYNDYNILLDLACLLRLNTTREIFDSIQADLKNLSYIPVEEIKELLDNDLKAYDLNSLYKNIENLLSKRGKREDNTPHLINFYEDYTWEGTI